jgi:hypothetical protein
MTELQPTRIELAGLRRADGTRLHVGKVLGSGGEGWVYQVDGQGQGRTALKLYKRDQLHAHSSRLMAKLQQMIDRPPDNPTADLRHPSLAWPEEIILDRQGNFAGFTMPLLDSRLTLAMHQVVNPSERTNSGLPGWISAYEDWGRLVHTAANLAAATQSLHDANYVIGDFNESNILVTDRALVTLIDCDSMQVPARNGNVFLCTVGKPEFTAPEVQDFKIHPRTKHADNFALAVHCFMLLMWGRHPFSGIWHGSGDKPSQLALARRGLYCIAGHRSLEPQRGTPPATVLPASLINLFARAFSHPADPSTRPSAEEWKTALFAFEASLTACSRNPQHHYGSHLSRCPWCQIEATRAASARSARPSAQPTGQRPYQPPGSHQATGSYQPKAQHQPTATPYGAQAFRPPAGPRYPNTYRFKPAGSGRTRRRYTRPFAILSAIMLAILVVTAYSLQHTSSPGPSAPNRDSPSGPGPAGPGDYAINRQISADSLWTLTLTDIRVTASGQAKFIIKYANTDSTSAQLTCSGNTNPTISTVTLSSGQTIASTATYCSEHPDDTAINIGPRQYLMSYAIFPDASQLRQQFNFHWSADSLSGDLTGLQIPD